MMRLLRTLIHNPKRRTRSSISIAYLYAEQDRIKRRRLVIKTGPPSVLECMYAWMHAYKRTNEAKEEPTEEWKMHFKKDNALYVLRPCTV